MTAGDRPRLCLLPGLDGTGRLYAPLVTALADVADVDVLAYDSEQFKDYPELAEALAPRLPASGHVVLVAESFAGPLAVLLAHRHPACVRGLVLAASFVHAPLPASRMGATLLGLGWNFEQVLTALLVPAALATVGVIVKGLVSHADAT